MRTISDIEIIELGEENPESSSPWSSTILLLKMTTSDGIVGYGEAPTTMMTRAVLEQMREIARIFRGKNPEELNSNMMEAYKNSFYMPVSVETTAAASAFEIASWDIIGKIYGMPLYGMLGGKMRNKVRAYANGWYSDCISPEEFARKARHMHKMGFTAVKFDPFHDAYDTIDREHVKHAKSVVEAVGNISKDFDTLIEFHGRFSLRAAISAAKALDPLKPFFIEEPVHPDQFESLVRLREVVSSPIALGERVLDKNLFIKYFTNDLVDIIQPDLTNFGGVMEAFKVAAIADSFGVDMAFHNAFGPIQSIATVNVDFAIRNFAIQESFESSWPEWKRRLVRGYSIKDGYFTLEGKPGIGAKVNERIIEEYKISGMEPFDRNEPPWVVKGTFHKERRGNRTSRSGKKARRR